SPAHREERAPARHAEEAGLGLLAGPGIVVEDALEALPEAGQLAGALLVDLSQLAANFVAVDVHVSRAPWRVALSWRRRSRAGGRRPRSGSPASTGRSAGRGPGPRPRRAAPRWARCSTPRRRPASWPGRPSPAGRSTRL